MKNAFVYLASKSAFDYFFSIFVLVLLFPLFFLVGLCVKLTSRGPIFYSQERVGRDGVIFRIHKFRTMVEESEPEGPVWARKSDPRLTPIGKFLKDHHLDELPQFFNVLKGEMSVIGPRPERPHFVEQFEKKINGYTKRHKIKPGITGLAQTRQSYDVTIDDVRRKCAMDIMYMKEMNWSVDLQIFFQTIRVLFTGKVYPPPKQLQKYLR